jgi:nitrite reductase/ring-hydroxylating ferredoxin subunit
LRPDYTKIGRLSQCRANARTGPFAPPAQQLQTISTNFAEAQEMAEVFVAKVADFPDGDRKIVQHGTHDIGVFHWEGQFYAYSNLCLHQGGPACEGLLMHQVEDVIGPDKTWVGQKFSDQQINFVCPWHGYEYDLKTGECVPDRRLRLKKYNVVRKGDEIFVSI